MLTESVSEGNKLRWDGKNAPFYEVYYLKFVDRDARWSFWARYTVLSPAVGEPSASLWGIFQQALSPAIALKKTYLLSEIDIFHRDCFIQIGESRLTIDLSTGFLQGKDHQLMWEIYFEDPTISLGLYPHEWFYRGSFPKTKFVEPRFSTQVSGQLMVDKTRLDLHSLPAHQAHLWGSGYAQRWVWGHCNQFAEDESAMFEGLVAQVNVAGLKTPPLALFCFVLEGRKYLANSVIHWFRNVSSHELTLWTFEAQCEGLKFMGTVKRNADLVTGVEYEGPNGEKRYCHSSMMAEMELTVFERDGKNWKVNRKLTSRLAAFETVEPKVDERVRIVL